MRYQGLTGIPIGAVVLTLIAHPVWAAPTEVTAIQLKPTSLGIELVFQTQGNNRPPIFTVSRGNNSVADIANTQLRLPGGKPFRQENPVPGITAVEVRQLDANTVQVVVSGATRAPIGQVIRRDGPGLALNFIKAPDTVANQPATPAPSQPPSTGQTPNATPPVLPRAVAPPTGDIAVAPIEVLPDTIDLGTTERIPKLLLREAPVREVLTLLGRAAGINIAFAEGNGETSTGAVTGGPKVSLDVEDEPVQDVFNYVLRLSGLQANRVGNTIFVGQALPEIARNRIVRTYRLNQIKATSKTTTIDTTITTAQTGGSASGTSGEAQISEEGGQFSATGSEGSSSLAVTALNRGTQTTEVIRGLGAKEMLESYGANGGGGAEAASSTSEKAASSTSEEASGTLLEGLEVVADSRANTVTLIGSPRTVEIATSLLTQMDIRRRQAVIEVKIVDVDLLKQRSANADINFNSTDTVVSGFINGVFQIGAVLGNSFLLNLATSIRDRSAKILTSPTLIVQEGSAAQVNLTQEIFSGVKRETTAVGATGALPTITETPIIRPAGVILNVTVDQIDDNGFLSLKISPEVSVPSGTFQVSGTTGTLLQQRRLETGRMRLRDGQTLVLTGIIQDEDRADVSKVPILGDIPLLGRLFRQETKDRERRELVVLVTPRIMDNSDQSAYGYQYSPSPEAQKLIKPQPPQPQP